jgi:hypothetical protein
MRWVIVLAAAALACASAQPAGPAVGMGEEIYPQVVSNVARPGGPVQVSRSLCAPWREDREIRAALDSGLQESLTRAMRDQGIGLKWIDVPDAAAREGVVLCLGAIEGDDEHANVAASLAEAEGAGAIFPYMSARYFFERREGRWLETRGEVEFKCRE